MFANAAKISPTSFYPVREGRELKLLDPRASEIEEKRKLVSDSFCLGEYIGQCSYGGLTYAHCWKIRSEKRKVTILVMMGCENCKASPRVQVTSTHQCDWVDETVSNFVACAKDVLKH